MYGVMQQVSSLKTLLKRLKYMISVLNVGYHKAFLGSAVVLTDNNVLSDIDKTTGKITGVGGTKSRIGKSLSRAAGGNEVFLNVKAFTVI